MNNPRTKSQRQPSPAIPVLQEPADNAISEQVIDELDIPILTDPVLPEDNESQSLAAAPLQAI